jgi:hypothetical protein
MQVKEFVRASICPGSRTIQKLVCIPLNDNITNKHLNSTGDLQKVDLFFWMLDIIHNWLAGPHVPKFEWSMHEIMSSLCKRSLQSQSPEASKSHQLYGLGLSSTLEEHLMHSTYNLLWHQMAINTKGSKPSRILLHIGFPFGGKSLKPFLFHTAPLNPTVLRKAKVSSYLKKTKEFAFWAGYLIYNLGSNFFVRCMLKFCLWYLWHFFSCNLFRILISRVFRLVAQRYVSLQLGVFRFYYMLSSIITTCQDPRICRGKPTSSRRHNSLSCIEEIVEMTT